MTKEKTQNPKIEFDLNKSDLKAILKSHKRFAYLKSDNATGFIHFEIIFY